MAILYLTYDGLTDPLGQSQILPYLEGLAYKGHDITVISFEKGRRLKAKSLRLKVIPLKYRKSPPVLSTLYDIYLLRKEVKTILNTQQIDIIHCRSYITSLVGFWAKRRYGVKFIFDMRGFWADERVEGRIWNIKNPLFRWVYNYFKKKEKQFIREADAVISLTNNAKKEILSWKEVNIASKKITVIPTCADLDHFSPLNISEYQIKHLQLKHCIGKDDYILLYLGSLGTWYMLQEMLDYYDVVRKNFENAKFLFLTKDQDVLHQALRDREYNENEIIITSAPRNEVPQFIALSTASIFFIIPTFSKKASAATKMGEIMAMGKPVITNSGWGDVEEIIHQDNGIVIQDFKVGTYKNSMADLQKLIKTNPVEIRKTADKYFSLKVGVGVYNDIYEGLSKN